MQRRNIILVGAAGALVLLNLWRWLPSSSTSDGSVAQSRLTGPVTVQSLKLHGVAAASGDSVGPARNLFAPFVPAAPVPVKIPSTPPPVEATKRVSAKDSARNAARADMSQYQLVGIVIRPGKAQAFLMKGDQPYDVGVGDIIDGRIRVQKVSAAEVVLKDNKTKVTRIVPLADN